VRCNKTISSHVMDINTHANRLMAFKHHITPTAPAPLRPGPTPGPQDFITGPSQFSTYGYFGVDQVTGEGYSLASNAWADSPEQPTGNHCIDTWTTAPISVPVSGLTPYPADSRGQPDWAAQVVITPVAMLTLGDTSSASVPQKYDAAYASVNVKANGGAYGAGMVNSDPLLMLQTGDPVKIGVAVGSLVASAKVLDTLSLARALYECREGAGARLSNELFNQVRVCRCTADRGDACLDAVC
jgi:hypothetical protein